MRLLLFLLLLPVVLAAWVVVRLTPTPLGEIIERSVELRSDLVAFGSDSSATFDLKEAFRSVGEHEERLLVRKHLFAVPKHHTITREIVDQDTYESA
jgi:hypothetical protein